jgi:hypothetical protein
MHTAARRRVALSATAAAARALCARHAHWIAVAAAQGATVRSSRRGVTGAPVGTAGSTPPTSNEGHRPAEPHAPLSPGTRGKRARDAKGPPSARRALVLLVVQPHRRGRGPQKLRVAVQRRRH